MFLRIGPYRIDSGRRVVWNDNQLVNLPPRAVDFLLCLAEHRGNVVPKEEILQRVWQGRAVEDNGVAQIVVLLRRTLKEGFGDQNVIVTVPRRGYRLMVDVLEEPDTLPAGSGEETGPRQALADEEAPEPFPHPAARPRRQMPLAVWALGLVVAAGLIATVGTQLPGRSVPPVHVYPLTEVTYDELMPSISPDGAQVAYSRKLPGEAFYSLFLKVIGGPPAKKIIDSEGDALWAAWSPDGELIAYSRPFADHGEVRAVTPLGRGDEMLVRLKGPQAPTLGWSPDGKTLAFANNATPDGGIFLYTLENARQRRLTAPPRGAEDKYPRFAPDGTLVAFLRRGAEPGREELYVMPVSGGPARRVLETEATIQGIAFTRDGKELVYASDVEGTKYLYRVGLSAGSLPAKVATGPDAEEPSLAAGKDRLAFGVFYESELLWRNTVGKDDRKVVELPGFRRLEPRFSPDGKRLAFVANATGFDEVWVANADGSDARALTSGGDHLACLPGVVSRRQIHRLREECGKRGCGVGGSIGGRHSPSNFGGGWQVLLSGVVAGRKVALCLVRPDRTQGSLATALARGTSGAGNPKRRVPGRDLA